MAVVLRATWSLEEAAHLVHEVNPDTNPMKLSETSSDPVSKTYYWLKKEYGRGRLYNVSGTELEPRFSPGTLMRHLDKNGRYVSKVVWDFYNAANAQKRDTSSSKHDRKVYIKAAKLIWAEHPLRPALTVAEDLVGLPLYFTNNYLGTYDKATIRKWLRGLGPRKVGRPKKGGVAETGSSDLKKILQALDEN